MDTATIESPCVDVCELSADDLCIGCGRSLDEIGNWMTASSAEKAQVLERARQRLTQMAAKVSSR